MTMTPTQREAALRLADDMNTPISVWADHVAHLLRELAKTDDDVLDVRENDNKRVISAIEDAWTKGFRTGQQAEPDMRHPKIQALIGSNARYQIELSLVEQLLEDPEFETTSMDMEYWLPLHDKLKAALTDGEPRIDNYPLYSGLPPLPQCEPVAWHVCSVNSDGSLSLEFAAPWEELAHEHVNDAINEHDIDGAASWVVRPVYASPQPQQTEPAAWIQPDHLQKARVAPFLCRVEPTKRMSDFVPLYAHPPQQRKPLTDEQMKEVMSAAGVRVFQPGLWDVLVEAGRSIERHYGIGEAP